MDLILATAMFGAIVATFDIYWVLRLFLVQLVSLFRQTKSVTDEFCTYSICWTTDIDIFIHMNNGKYFRELDFARFDFYFLTGIFSSSWRFTILFWFGALNSLFGNINEEKRVYIVQHGAMIRFRKPLNFLMPFVVKTKMVFFDKTSLYFEQTFISKPDNFVRAIALCKNTVVNCPDVVEFMREMYNVSQPECPPDLAKYLEANDISSKKLRQESSVNSNKED